MRRFIPFLIVILAATCGLTVPAEAHAILVRSVPAAGAALAGPPAEIVLEFSEAVDPAATRVELFAGSGQVVVGGPGVVDPGERKALRLAVAALPDGVYSAVWRARSAVDGHTTTGSVGFSVGAASSPASRLPPPGAPDPATTIPTLAETLARWLVYLSAVTALGSLSFGFLVWRPAVQPELDTSAAADEAVRRLIRSITLASLAVLGVATVGFAVIQAARAFEISPFAALGAGWQRVFVGRPGALQGLRLVLILILGWQVLRLPAPAAGSSRVWLLDLVLGSLLLLTFSLQGHGAAHGSILAAAVSWLHLSATVVWLGGLPMLYLALRQAGVSASALVPRFSKAALASVGVIAATGLYNALVFVRTGEALAGTTYGRALVVKTGIFALLFALGAANLFILSPRLREAGRPARTALRRSVRIELALGALLLLAVGVLTSVAPGFEALQERQAQGIIAAARVDGVKLLVRAMPGETGDNEIGVEFTDKRPGAAQVTPEVLLRLTALGMDMGTQQVQATSVDGLRYTARGSYFSMAGPWEVEVILRRPGYNDVRRTFELEIRDRVPQ